MKPLVELLDDVNILIRLNEVSFKRIEDEPEEESRLVVEDSYEISEVQDTMFGVRLTRHVCFFPAAFFDIKVEFEIGRCLVDGIDASIREYDLDKFISEENVDEITGYNFNRVSSIISDLTSSFGLSPLITPPVYSGIEEES